MSRKTTRFHAVLLVVGICIISGCTTSRDPDCEAGEDLDGGFECVEGATELPNDPQRLGDGGGDTLNEATIDDFCRQLVDLTCGRDGISGGVVCDDTSACTAATLLATYEPEQCQQALDDDRRYPPCRANACEELVIRVCGALDDTAGCGARTECELAERMLERQEGSESVPADPDGLAACSAALDDSVLFPTCSL